MFRISEEQLSWIKGFISKERLNPEIMNKLEITQEEEKEVTELKWFTKDIIKHTILENLKQ